MIDFFNQAVEFVLGAANVRDLPSGQLPEICFIGRSNVGKSSLLNALFNNKKLARTSKTPGCTQQLNIFKVADRFIIVDVPGYGYAQAAKRKVLQWNQLILAYLSSRPQLYRVYLLIDSKVGIKDSDKEIIEFLANYGTSCQLILTKADKVGRENLKTRIDELTQYIKKQPNVMQDIIYCSAANKDVELVRNGINELISNIL